MSISLNSTISRNPDVAFTQIDDDLVMMGPEDNLFYGVNPVGTKIWSLLEFDTLSVSDICEHIQQDYAVTGPTCIEDTMHFIQAMAAQNMVVITACP